MPLKLLVHEVGKMLRRTVTKPQLEYKIKQWGLKRLDPAKVERETNRYREWKYQVLSTQSQLNPARFSHDLVLTQRYFLGSPSITELSVTISTPPPVHLEFDWPKTLPWVQFQTALLPQELQGMSWKGGLGSLGIRGMGLGLQKLASGLGIVMPESYKGEHLYRAGAITGPSGLDFLHQCLGVIIFMLSNGILNLLSNNGTWDVVSAVLRHSGLLSRKYLLNIPTSHSTTVSAFLDKLWAAAVWIEAEGEDKGAKVIIEWLLTSGYDPETPLLAFSLGWGRRFLITPVQVLTSCLRTEALQLLLKHGANADLRPSSNSGRPLVLALERERPWGAPGRRLPPVRRSQIFVSQAVGAAHLLMDYRATLNSVSDSEPLLIMALRLGDPDFVSTILARGVDIKFRHYDKKFGDDPWIHEATAFTAAAGFYDESFTDDVRNERAITLISCVISAFRTAMLSVEDWITADAFIAAARAGNYDVVQFLSGISSVNVNSWNKFGISPLHAAARSGCLKTYKALLDLGCEFSEDASTDVVRPLHLACLYGHDTIVDFCIRRHAAEVNAKATLDTYTGPNPIGSLYLSVLTRCREMAGFQRIGHTAPGFATPLELAMIGAHDEIALYLLRNGARLYGMELYTVVEMVRRRVATRNCLVLYWT
ncbi:hypothetical protein MFIFM68171_03600 [Madurella fahalii]|uniref:Ankyrin n=1 Tax=Madurella fahalii TaxID=1157608 RepID=A0ABQ0G6P5_9PEZI